MHFRTSIPTCLTKSVILNRKLIFRVPSVKCVNVWPRCQSNMKICHVQHGVGTLWHFSNILQVYWSACSSVDAVFITQHYVVFVKQNSKAVIARLVSFFPLSSHSNFIWTKLVSQHTESCQFAFSLKDTTCTLHTHLSHSHFHLYTIYELRHVSFSSNISEMFYSLYVPGTEQWGQNNWWFFCSLSSNFYICSHILII